MKQLRTAEIVTTLLVAASGFAQTESLVLAAGTRLRVILDTSITSKTSRVGDGVEVRLIEPVKLREQVVLPADTYLAGRVAAVRTGNRKQKAHATLRLSFDKITLPDGHVLQAKASIQNLGIMLDVDSEGMVTQPGISKSEAAGVVAVGTAAGAGIGAGAGGGKGAVIGAGAGAALSTLADLVEGSAQWDDFELNRGRKMWLRLDLDLPLPSEGSKPPVR
jgi:hypothetical protein